ncbi:MAG: outer membrane lipoprotein carrier protein LolA [Treponema sp.]|nr:outer membrane lipoprotein carrier protein LolA [Treponema sp.]
MKKHITAALLFLSIFFRIFPEEGESRFSGDEVGLETVCKAISSKKITKGDFKQIKFIQRLKREMASSGIFVISSDDGILWQTQKPYFSNMAMTKSAIIQTNAKGKKTVMSSQSNATFQQFAEVLSSAFGGDAASLTKNFEVEFIGGSDNWNINLIPKNASVRKFVEEIEMAGRISIDVMTIHEANGDYIRYEFLNHIYPESLTEEEKSLFSVK